MGCIIGISGKMGSGKDTLAEMIQARLFTRSFQVKKFASTLKQISSILTGIPVENFERQDIKLSQLPARWNLEGQPMTVREFLQKVGTDAMRNHVHPDVWVNALLSGYRSDERWIISDVRFPNEADGIKNMGGMVVRINRKQAAYSDHISETALDEYNFDHVVNNNGDINLLGYMADDLCREINKKIPPKFSRPERRKPLY